MLRNIVLIALVTTLTLLAAPQLRAADPAGAQKWVAYGQQLYAQRQYDKAIQAFSSAAKLDARSAAAYKGLGNCFVAKRDYANALKYYKYSLQLNPGDTGLQAYIPKLAAAGQGGAAQASGPLAYAARYYQARRYDEAIQYYNQALGQNPNNAAAWQGLGNCYYAKKDSANAVNAYNKALALNPGNVALQNFIAKIAPGGSATAGADGPKDWVSPLWRSALLPGWGQSYNGQGGKGLLLGGLTVGLLGGTVMTYMSGAAARDKYLGLDATATQADFDSSYTAWESSANINHILWIGWMASWTWTMADAIMNARPISAARAEYFEKEPSLQMALTELGTPALTWRMAEF